MTRRNAKLSSLAKGEERSPITFESNGLASAPKHVALPKLPPESELSFEIQTTILFIVAMLTQYLNLYRTVWWLSQSNTHTIVNFHLIDLNVIHFNIVFMGRYLLQHVILSIGSKLPTGRVTEILMYGSNLIVMTICTWIQLKCIYYIYLNHGVTGILCILYPFIIYILMYFPSILAAHEKYRLPFDMNMISDLISCLIQPVTFSSNPPIHCCSSNTVDIREEVDRLKTSFNDRLKFILFRSLVVAYFSCFVPLCLVQPQLFYDVTWTAQHVGICWLSAFLLLTSHLYSPHFYDVLHKSSLHLGKWQKLETRNTLVPCTQWADKLLYAQGVVVKHCREYFKAEGVANCAEPGNQSHLRFYVVFSNPVGGFGTLLGLLLLLITAQLLLLIRSHEWYKIISMSCTIVVNSMTIFRLVRSYYVLREVYKVESNLQESSHLHSQ